MTGEGVNHVGAQIVLHIDPWCGIGIGHNGSQRHIEWPDEEYGSSGGGLEGEVSIIRLADQLLDGRFELIVACERTQ